MKRLSLPLWLTTLRHCLLGTCQTRAVWSWEPDNNRVPSIETAKLLTCLLNRDKYNSHSHKVFNILNLTLCRRCVTYEPGLGTARVTVESLWLSGREKEWKIWRFVVPFLVETHITFLWPMLVTRQKTLFWTTVIKIIIFGYHQTRQKHIPLQERWAI